MRDISISASRSRVRRESLYLPSGEVGRVSGRVGACSERANLWIRRAAGVSPLDSSGESQDVSHAQQRPKCMECRMTVAELFQGTDVPRSPTLSSFECAPLQCGQPTSCTPPGCVSGWVGVVCIVRSLSRNSPSVSAVCVAESLGDFRYVMPAVLRLGVTAA